MSEGRISLLKAPGEKVSMTKTPLIRATTSWVKRKDYDIACEVLYRNGAIETVVTYETEEGGVPVMLQSSNGAVVHSGDVGTSLRGRPSETIEIRLTDDIRAIVIWGYSARKNLSGSFKEYEVELAVDNGQGEKVVLPPEHMSDNPGIYTLVFGTIHNHQHGVEIEKLELYSNGGERRPRAWLDLARDKVLVEVDTGETNVVKK